MQIIFVNGRSRQSDWREMREVLSHPASVALFLLGIFLFQALPFDADFPAFPPRFAALFWAHVMIVYVLGYLGIVALWERTGRPLWTALVQLALAALLTLTGTAIYFGAGLPVAPDLGTLAAFWLFLSALLLFSELIFMTFVFDLVRPRQAEPADSARDMPVLFVTGQRRRLQFRDVYAVLLHPANVVLVLATVGGMAMFHPYPVIRLLPVHLAVPFWFHVLALFYLSFLALVWFCRKTGVTFVVPVALLICSTLLTLSSGLFLAMATGSVATQDEIVSYTFFHWSVLIFVEFLVVIFVLDRALARPSPTAGMAALVPILPDLPAAAPSQPAAAPPPDRAPTPSQPPVLTLQGVEIPAAEISLITAEEHYLRIVTDGRTRLLRGRMSDVEAQMPEGLGMRVHRSHWVAGRVVQGLRRTETGWSIACSVGRDIPIARGRQGAVREWVQVLEAAAAARRSH